MLPQGGKNASLLSPPRGPLRLDFYSTDLVVVQFEICRPSAAKAAMKIRLTARLKPCPFKTDSNCTTADRPRYLHNDGSCSRPNLRDALQGMHS